jgi:hypothetical protein
MQRGLITFTQTQLQTLLHLVLTNTLLTQKLTILPENNNSKIVELSADEVELLLDSLPMPNSTEEETLTELRKTLSTFLIKLRS